MTVNIQIATIADAISNLSISGVNNYDIDKIPESAIDFCPALFPAPDNYVTDLQFTVQSFGGDSARKLDVSYTLNYRFLYAPIGSGSVLQNYAGLIAKLELILEALLGASTPTGSIDMSLLGVSNIGPLSDPAGQTMYHGVEIALRILEYTQ
jgi:hypothetical protein